MRYFLALLAYSGFTVKTEVGNDIDHPYERKEKVLYHKSKMDCKLTNSLLCKLALLKVDDKNLR